MSLPIEWVEKLFTKLTMNYGVEFLNRYKGIPIMDVKTDWSDELSGFDGVQISYALGVLPDRAPTAQQFKNICLLAPASKAARIEPPKADPAIAKMVMERLAVAPAVHAGRLDWAKAIMRDHIGGLRRTPTVVAMARRALGESA